MNSTKLDWWQILLLLVRIMKVIQLLHNYIQKQFQKVDRLGNSSTRRVFALAFAFFEQQLVDSNLK